jgi:hypothetical protein
MMLDYEPDLAAARISVWVVSTVATMKLTVIDPPSRSFSRWLTEEEIGQVLANKRGWRLGPDGGIYAGKVVKKRIAPSLTTLGTVAILEKWAHRSGEPRSDGSGPTHMMWGVFDARADAEIAARVTAHAGTVEA